MEIGIKNKKDHIVWRNPTRTFVFSTLSCACTIYKRLYRMINYLCDRMIVRIMGKTIDKNIRKMTQTLPHLRGIMRPNAISFLSPEV